MPAARDARAEPSLRTPVPVASTKSCSLQREHVCSASASQHDGYRQEDSWRIQAGGNIATPAISLVAATDKVDAMLCLLSASSLRV